MPGEARPAVSSFFSASCTVRARLPVSLVFLPSLWDTLHSSPHSTRPETPHSLPSPQAPSLPLLRLAPVWFSCPSPCRLGRRRAVTGYPQPSQARAQRRSGLGTQRLSARPAARCQGNPPTSLSPGKLRAPSSPRGGASALRHAWRAGRCSEGRGEAGGSRRTPRGRARRDQRRPRARRFRSACPGRTCRGAEWSGKMRPRGGMRLTSRKSYLTSFLSLQ